MRNQTCLTFLNLEAVGSQKLNFSFARSLALALTGSLARSLTGSLADWLARSLTGSLANWLAREGGREGARKGGREGGREGEREQGREGARSEGGREGGSKGGREQEEARREREREGGGREGGREKASEEARELARLLTRSRFHHSNTLVYLTRLLRPPKCIWGADCNWRWWGHLMTILCNRTRSNFLNCKTMGNQKLKFSLARSLGHSPSLARSLSRFHHSNTLVYLTHLLRPPKCIWGADCNWRWWGHLMTILCNRTRSNFLNCKTMENQKLKFSLAR